MRRESSTSWIRFCALALALLSGMAVAASASPASSRLASPSTTAPCDPRLFAGLDWRMIGPYRGGRTVAAAGVSGQPSVFYIGVNNGGIWRSTDYGRTWRAIFDDQPTGSIGSLAIAPSDPNILYAGSGEGLQRPDLSVGDGIYKSVDGGRSWRHLGLRDGQQIPSLAVDPGDPNRLFAAVLGHPYGPSSERGIFRSTDGGESWERVLYRDENTGGMDVVMDPSNPRTVFAVLWAARQPPWEGDGGSWVLPEHNGVYKSTDGGANWRRITVGLPGVQDTLGRVGLAVCPAEPRRMYAVLGAKRGGGLYRSDDGGEQWQLINADRRLRYRDGDFNEVKVDPKNPNVVYVANVMSWKSTDGGKSFEAWRGAPGGDDYHRVWINPDDPKIILLAGDQGAVVTVNGGDTWSSWYNQPTAQIFHVSTDDAFPYRVYGSQQESGSAGVLSRGNDGHITFRDWHPAGAEEYGYVVPDPLHPGVVFGGKLNRYDWATGQVQEMSPDPLGPDKYRWVRTMPLVFSPVDPQTLYLGANVLLQTRDGGKSWKTISPDLTRPTTAVPATVGAFGALDSGKGSRRGVIYSVDPSPLRGGLLWAGTDDGLVHVTHDAGGHWQDVTPRALTPWSKVSVIEASHFDTLEAYTAVNRFRLDDLRPHIYRTRDGGANWREIVAGIPEDEVVNVVREDPLRKGLLFAGTERGVHVSFNDGDSWQSLRLNMPATSVRDLVVHGSDLVAGTHGRSIWILDDFQPLRQAAEAGAAPDAFLFAPSLAVRARWNTNTDTPLPFDEPTARNPPDGAIVDYAFAMPVDGTVSLEILAADGSLVRRYSSADPPDTIEADLNIPPRWIRPEQRIATGADAHRLVWDFHYPPPPAIRRGYPIAAVEHDTPLEPRGPWVLPGRYAVRLHAGGKCLEESLTVRMDPRAAASRAELEQQFVLAQRLVGCMRSDSAGADDARALRSRIAALRAAPGTGGDGRTIDSLDLELKRIQEGVEAKPEGAPRPETLAGLAGKLGRLYGEVGQADAAPTQVMMETADELERALDGLLARMRGIGDRARNTSLGR